MAQFDAKSSNIQNMNGLAIFMIHVGLGQSQCLSLTVDRCRNMLNKTVLDDNFRLLKVAKNWMCITCLYFYHTTISRQSVILFKWTELPFKLC